MKPTLVRALGALALVTGLAALTGCHHGSAYTVVPLPKEELRWGRLDGHWFERHIYAEGSGQSPTAVELLYCPIVKEGPTVCRTAVIWRDGVTTLLEGDNPNP